MLHVRQIECRHGRVARLQVRADRPNSLGAGEIADDRYHEVSGLEILQVREALLAREVPARAPGTVGGQHEIRIGRLVSRPEPFSGRVPDARPVGEERVVDVLNPLHIVAGEREAVSGGELTLDVLQVADRTRPGSARPADTRKKSRRRSTWAAGPMAACARRAARRNRPGPRTARTALCTSGEDRDSLSGCRR